MAPHISAAGQDMMLQSVAKGKSPIQIHSQLQKRRARQEMQYPNLTNVRKFLKGAAYKRGHSESRGAKMVGTLQLTCAE